MYEEFYGLREKPFSRTPDPRFLYQGRKHAEALRSESDLFDGRRFARKLEALLLGMFHAGDTGQVGSVSA